MRIIDAHTHLDLFAYKSIPIERAKSKKELLEMIGSAGKGPLASWGWNEEIIGGQITRQDIDIFPYPVLLIRVDGHMGVINKEVIDKYNLKPSDKFKPDTGFVYEDELWRIASVMKPKNLRQPLMLAQEEAISNSIVEVHDFVRERTAETYFKMREDGELKIKVTLMPYFQDYRKILKLFDKYGDDEIIKLGWVKAFVDGSIGARTAYLSASYTDNHSRGLLLKNQDEIQNIVQEIERQKLRLSLHVIGDSAIETTLDALKKASKDPCRHRLEHVEMISHEQAGKVKEMDLTLCVQPNFNPVFMDTYIKALGEERAEKMNPLKMLDEMKINMIFGSDMMPFEPRIGLDYATKILGNEKAIFYYGGWCKTL